MIDRTNPPMLLRLPDRSPNELDRLLQGFFREEMPEPWPAWSPPVAEPVAPAVLGRRRWVALRRRLAVAASVALILVTYLMLSWAFPGSSGSSRLPFEPGKTVGHKPPFRQAHPLTPMPNSNQPRPAGLAPGF